LFKKVIYAYIQAMETNPSIEILDLGPAIDNLKSLSSKFRETGDYEYMMEILLIIDDIESPMLVDFFDMDMPDIDAKA
tara:strand:- start:315 stop:548 length:234 start_codon:yes stop_codon:yes gene_type:complete